MYLLSSIDFSSGSPSLHQVRECDDEEGGDFVDGLSLAVEILEEGDVGIGWACGALKGVDCEKKGIRLGRGEKAGVDGGTDDVGRFLLRL